MAIKKFKDKTEEKVSEKNEKAKEKIENIGEENKIEKENSPEKKEEKIEEKEKKPEEKKNETKETKKKEKAIVRGLSLRISAKQSKFILKMIKGKKIDDAIKMLEEVLEFKRAVPMKGAEIPHRRGMEAGRYPLNTSKEIIKLLKQLKANSNVCGIENPYINLAISNISSRPYRRGRVRGKRTHIYLEAKEFQEEK